MKSYQSRFCALVADDEPMMRQAVTAAVPLLAAVALMSLLTDMFAVFPTFPRFFPQFAVSYQNRQLAFFANCRFVRV